MMQISAKQEALADLLVEARRDARQLASLPDDLVPETAASAYQVNHIVAERLGWPALGWKIAGTTDAVRGKLGLGGPLPPLPAILADGSASGRYVFGDRIANWRDGLASMRVRLEVDGTLRREGSGSDVMGDPLLPLLWLAEERRRWGDGLRAGETISTGSMTGMLPARAGQSVRAWFGDVGTVEIAFEG
jgi:2-keto-4-pentenoate hydratase